MLVSCAELKIEYGLKRFRRGDSLAATSGSSWRKLLVATVAIVGCVMLLLFCARVAVAQPLVATWYGPGFEGNLTANGEVFDPSGYTAAHKTYEFDTKLIVTYEGRSVVVRINDRGPFVAGRDLDLAQGAAEYIGLTAVGVDTVDAEIAAPSTPVGPYAPKANNQQARPAAASGSSTKPNQNKPARQQNGGNGNGNSGQAGAAGRVAAVEDQYAAEDQYEANQGQQTAPEPPPPAPKPPEPVLPPEPEPEALLSPPKELAVPNSTVQKRVEFEIAAAPTPQPEVVEEEPAPEPEPEPEPTEELTVLPDTGGTLPLLPAAGGLLVAVGISIRMLRR